MIRQGKKLRFILLFPGLYLLFAGFSLFWIGLTSKDNLYWPFADEHLNFVNMFRHFLLTSAKILCSTLGYETSFFGEYGLRVENRGIRLVYSCLGLGVMSLYAAFILTWPSPFPVRARWVPLLSGLAIITFLNILRLALLPILHIEYPGTRQFPVDHHDVFNTILYIVIAGMIYLWTRNSQKAPE